MQTITATIQLKGSSAPIIVVRRVDTIDAGNTSLLNNIITKKTNEAITNGKGTFLVVESPVETLDYVAVLFF